MQQWGLAAILALNASWDSGTGGQRKQWQTWPPLDFQSSLAWLTSLMGKVTPVHLIRNTKGRRKGKACCTCPVKQVECLLWISLINQRLDLRPLGCSPWLPSKLLLCFTTAVTTGTTAMQRVPLCRCSGLTGTTVACQVQLYNTSYVAKLGFPEQLCGRCGTTKAQRSPTPTPASVLLGLLASEQGHSHTRQFSTGSPGL